ncbi:PREDICTED: protein FAM92A1-like isoform X1 [Branchiostoma belcheri]|uniref:Protein FAM92A1-like isoform X1 n=1 Tax=Branchiostoma belcheri TaxID=7741 RepID=A0A6P5A577_BRABE|nr:PREDICTED: protein FAM92A1-like isoform X1 [Branchiostoma belcheri]
MAKNPEARAKENQMKFIQDRITKAEQHFGTLCQEFAAFSRKTAKLRDKGDELAKALLTYAEAEGQSLKSGVTGFAETISAIQDYRQAEVQRLEAKVVQPLTLYGNTCKHAKEDLKKSQTARGKEQQQQQRLEKARQKNPSDRHTISQVNNPNMWVASGSSGSLAVSLAESELQRAAVDATRSDRALEEQMDNFERQKMEDIKKILTDFVHVEMVFHCKALELYTVANQYLQGINDEDDLEEFRNSMRPPSAPARLDLVRANSKTSLSSTARQTPGTERRATAVSRPQDLEESEEEEEEDDDEDEDEEDEEDDRHYRR